MSAGWKRKGLWELKFSAMRIKPTANSWQGVVHLRLYLVPRVRFTAHSGPCNFKSTERERKLMYPEKTYTNTRIFKLGD